MLDITRKGGSGATSRVSVRAVKGSSHTTDKILFVRRHMQALVQTPLKEAIISLKEEIEKLIQSEQQKTEERDQKHADHRDRQRNRFRPLRTLLEELVAAVEPNYIKSHILNDRVTIEIGRKEGDYFSADKRWEIQPDYGVRLTAEKGDSLVYEKPGFRVEERNYYHTPEFDVSEYTHTFETEQETAQYVIKQIAEQVAHYRYLESLTARYAERNKTPNHELEEDAL